MVIVRRLSIPFSLAFFLLVSSDMLLAQQVDLGPCYARAEKWGPTVARFYIDSSASQWERAIIDASASWSNLGGAGFTFTKEDGVRNFVRAVPGSHEVIVRGRVLGGTPLAVTESFRITRAGIVVKHETSLNLGMTFSTDTPPTANDVQIVLVHEFGHWIMFEDTNRAGCDKTTVMWWRADSSDVARRKPLQTDGQALRRLYQPPGGAANKKG